MMAFDADMALRFRAGSMQWRCIDGLPSFFIAAASAFQRIPSFLSPAMHLV